MRIHYSKKNDLEDVLLEERVLLLVVQSEEFPSKLFLIKLGISGLALVMDGVRLSRQKHSRELISRAYPVIT